MSDDKNQADESEARVEDRVRGAAREDATAGRSGSDRAQAEGREDEGENEGVGKADKKRSVFRKPLFWIVLVCVIAAIVGGGFLYWLYARQYESTDDAFIDAHIVRIAPTVAGTLVQVADADNRHVDAGRLLAVIEPTGPEAQLAEADANVKQAVAQLEQSRAQVAAAEATREQAAAQSHGPIANAAKAAQDLARYTALLRLDPNAVAGQQLDAARAQARATAADAAAARRQISSAIANVSVARRQVGAARAVVEARQALVKQARVTVGHVNLIAPISGQVVNRQVNLGSYVGPGTQLMAIVPDKIWVTANFKETQLKDMKIGQPVWIKVDAFPQVEFEGHVDSIQRGAGQAFALLPAQNATGNYVKVVQRVPVRIEFDAKNRPDPRKYPIGPGMSVVPTVKVR